MNEHKSTLQNTKKGTERGQTSGQTKRRLPKTHVDFWLARLRRRTYRDRFGRLVEIPEWQVRLKKDGREAWFNLGTANQNVAARKAKEIFVFLEANGWPATIARFKAGEDVSDKSNLTVGDYLAVVRNTGLISMRTFLIYENCLRTILAESFGIKPDRTRFDYKTGGNAQWRERIDRIRLDRVTPARITEWQRTRIAKAGASPIAIASAKRTANTYIRCARSLFSAKIRKALHGVQLPSPLPFDGVELFESGSMKYTSRINVGAMVAAAKSELRDRDPETYKVFLLALFAGMRKGEIDGAEWRMIDWHNNVIRLEQTEWLHLKTPDSAGEIALDPEVAAELRGFMKAAKSAFIVASERPPRNNSARPYYRCQPIFDRLTTWLRNKGVTANKPLHELRKEAGAIIASEHGIYAAARFLRHTDITTTARHYADLKTRISVGLGHMLDASIKAVKA